MASVVVVVGAAVAEAVAAVVAAVVVPVVRKAQKIGELAGIPNLDTIAADSAELQASTFENLQIVNTKKFIQPNSLKLLLDAAGGCGA